MAKSMKGVLTNNPDDFEAGGGMRTDIRALISKHRDTIDELRKQVGESLLQTSPEYDDIFLLRFALTWEKRGGLPKAIDAVKDTIEYRRKNKAVMDEGCRPGGKFPNEDKMLSFMTQGPAGSLGGLEPVFLVRDGHNDLKGLMASFSHEEVCDWLHFLKERAYRECDAKTRKTGKLIKSITIFEMSGASIFGMDRKFMKAIGETSKRAAIHYPQLLGKSVVINAPSFIRFLYAAVAPLLPKSHVEKFTICSATGTNLPGAQNASICPFIQKYCGGDLSTLPALVGGTSPTPEFLIPREELRAGAGLIKVHLANRSSTKVDIDAPTAGHTVKWEVDVENFGINMRVVLHPEDGTPAIELMPDTKIKADKGSAEGTFFLPKSGRMEVTFDNSYSIFRSKKFEYKISFLEEADSGAGGGAVDSLAARVNQAVHL